MKTRTLLFIAILTVLPVVSYGQIGNIIKNKAAKALNTVTKATAKEVNKEADSAAQKRADIIVNDAANNQNQNNQGNQTESQSNKGSKGFNLGGLLGGKVDIKHNDEYKFDGRMYMQMETYEKKDVMKMDYYVYFNSNGANAGIEFKNVSSGGEGSGSGATTMIYDNDNRCFMMLTGMTGQKTGIISTIPDDSTLKAQAANKQGGTKLKGTVTKTGNTRVIAGYKCDEYEYRDPENNNDFSELWVTKELNLKADRKNWSKAGFPAAYSGFEDGIVLAMESYEKNTLKMKMETKEINPGFSHSISTKDYSIIQMNFNQQGKK